MNRALACLIGFLLCVTHAVFGQINPGAAAISPGVTEITLDIRGGQPVSSDAVMAHIRLEAGQPYDQVLVDQSIRSLYETGLYEFIEVSRERIGSDSVRVIFTVRPKYRVSTVKFEGNENFSNKKLLKEIETQPGLALGEAVLTRDTRKIVEFYEKRGYANAGVKAVVQKDVTTGEASVTFQINEAEKLHISKITFVGNDHIASSKLAKQMETSSWNILSWLTGSGVLSEDMLKDDIERIKHYYKNEGYLDVEIPLSEVQYSYPAASKIVITIHIQERRQYHVGEVTFTGNTLYSTAMIQKIIRLKSGDVFSPDAVDRDTESIRDFYAHYGYLETMVRAERRPNLQTGNIDLNFIIQESDKFYVESINLQGNTKTKSTVILRELALAPGDTFDLIRMKTSQNRLQNTRFFEEVNMTPESVNLPNRKTLRITVKEQRTGSVSAGVTFSTVENAMIFAEVSQSNFDLFNYRNFFQGAGQKFRFRVSLGTKSSNMILAFEEPWLYDREVAGGFELFATEMRYLSSQYDEARYGGELYMRKRLFELVEGRLYYRLEEININNVKDEASSYIRESEGGHIVSKVGLKLLRDTRNNLAMPTRGSRLSLINEFAGLGGDLDYYRLEAQAGKWWPTFETLNQVFSLVGRLGTIAPYNGQKVPFYETYYLGGPNNLRGYSFRSIGPRDDSGEVIGGDTMAWFSTEYSVEVITPVRLAVFYDGGFVNKSAWTLSVDKYYNDIGFGARIFIMGAPLRLDFGYPLNVDEGMKKSWNFNFSFGVVF